LQRRLAIASSALLVSSCAAATSPSQHADQFLEAFEYIQMTGGHHAMLVSSWDEGGQPTIYTAAATEPLDRFVYV
jgi:hypothetical protein